MSVYILWIFNMLKTNAIVIKAILWLVDTQAESRSVKRSARQPAGDSRVLTLKSFRETFRGWSSCWCFLRLSQFEFSVSLRGLKRVIMLLHLAFRWLVCLEEESSFLVALNVFFFFLFPWKRNWGSYGDILYNIANLQKETWLDFYLHLNMFQLVHRIRGSEFLQSALCEGSRFSPCCSCCYYSLMLFRSAVSQEAKWRMEEGERRSVHSVTVSQSQVWRTASSVCETSKKTFNRKQSYIWFTETSEAATWNLGCSVTRQERAVFSNIWCSVETLNAAQRNVQKRRSSDVRERLITYFLLLNISRVWDCPASSALRGCFSLLTPQVHYCSCGLISKISCWTDE